MRTMTKAERGLVGRWRAAGKAGDRVCVLDDVFGLGGRTASRLLRLFAFRLADDATAGWRRPRPAAFDVALATLRAAADLGFDIDQACHAWSEAGRSAFSNFNGSAVIFDAMPADARVAALGAVLSHANTVRVTDPPVTSRDRVDFQSATLVAMVAPARTWDPAWNTSAAVALAASMYESGDYGPAPILADALQDAGCGDEAMLARVRAGSWAFPGCWVVDKLLSKR